MMAAREVERLLAYLVSVSIVGFGLCFIFAARPESELFTALLLGGACAIAVGVASLVNEIQNDRVKSTKVIEATVRGAASRPK